MRGIFGRDIARFSKNHPRPVNGEPGDASDSLNLQDRPLRDRIPGSRLWPESTLPAVSGAWLRA